MCSFPHICFHLIGLKGYLTSSVICEQTIDEFRDFFSKFGDVTEHQIMRDHSSNRSRGFGFVTFDSEESVDDLLSKGNRIEFAGTQVLSVTGEGLIMFILLGTGLAYVHVVYGIQCS